jgi:Immunity protein Imm5
VNEESEAALAALDAARDGWLDLPHRRRLWEAYGPAVSRDDAGLLRRAALMEAAVRRALPLWEAAFPGDRRPHEIADALLPALRGERSEEELDALADALRDDVERLGGDPGRREDYFTGSAAVRLTTQGWDGERDLEFDPPETRDLDLDEPRVEALAGWALAGEDPDARRAFWRWYVTEAFPAAYAVAE